MRVFKVDRQPGEPLTVVAGPWPSPVDEAEPRICSGCQAAVGISPSTVTMQWTRTRLRFLCIACSLREGENGIP